MQLVKGTSTRRYLPAKGTAGLERSCVSGKRRSPRPPPRIRPRVFSGTAFSSYHGGKKALAWNRDPLEINLTPESSMDSLKELLNGRPAVIARARNGQLVPGYLEKGKLLTRGILKMTDVSGEPVPIDIHKLKALFFVRDLPGNRDYLEEKTLVDDPPRPGLRVRLRFEDNETPEGVTANSPDLLVNPGFFFC